MDKFDDEYKDLLKDTSGLAAGLNRPVKEADIQLVPKPGGTMGNMYAPPGWEIRHKYKYKEDSDKDKVSSGGQAAAYTYPAGLGPVLMNGCFGTGYKNGDPCYKAKIPRTGCPNLIDGATYLGVGFDGRGVYSAESRKKSIIQRSCSNLQTYGKNEVPDCMTVQGIYDTGVESHAFNSMEEYRRYLEEKSAVTSAKAMFQEEIYKASAYSTIGNLIWAVGTGVSTQYGGSKQSSGSHASSSARGRLGEKQTQRFMAMLEINIFRYEIFMDDVKPDQLSVGFLRDFISLPQSYFSSGAEIAFQNFYLRWGTHYIKSATFGGQLKIMKTKVATKDLSMSEFATRAEADWKMTLNTFGAYASQSNIEFGYIKEAKTEIKQKNGKAAAGSASSANRYQWKQASSQEYSSEVMVVQGGDQKIAAAITEMYTTALTTELKDWLESIDDYPKPFSFVLRPVSELLNIPFDSLFPAGNVDYGCLGTRQLKTEKKTGRKYYTQETVNPDVGNTAAKNSSKTIMVSEIRYCDFADRNDLENSMTKRRLSLERAVTVYLEEGRLLSSDFLLPAGEAGCETAMLAYLQGSKSGVPTWKEMIGGNEFTVIFDMPYDIPGIIQAQDVLQLKFISRMWLSTRIGSAPHLYDGYDNGGSNDVQEKKVSVQGLVMTYTEGTGVFTVTDDDFKASVSILPDLPQWIKGRKVARAEYKKLLNHLGRKMDTMGDVPCSIQWSNAHNFNPNGKGKCIHFTAASEGDIFVVFASIPQNHETWIYIQISPEGVALYKAMRLQTTQLNDKAGGLGSATLYQSYFACVTEDATDKTTVIQYGKMPYNEERPHVWLGFTFHEVASLRYYSFGSGESPVKVMGLSLLDKPAKDFIICREGTEMVDGVCRQKCHPECKGCRTSGSNSPTDCIACKHLKVSKDRQIGSFECVTQCPPHMQASIATKTCTCIKKMEKAHPDGVVYCVTDCPLTHFDDNNVCKKCSSFCKDINHVGNSQSNALNQTNVVGKRICSGPASTDCDTCKYQHEGRCVEECRPGQKAVKTGEHGAFTCRRCHPGHECKLGDEREDICPAGTASNDKSTKCVPCAAGEFSNSSGAASCQKCPAGKYSTGGGSTSCLDCPAGKYSSTAGSTGCTICPAGKYSSRTGSDLCETCPAGKYSEKESTVCKTCPVGKYSSKVGSTGCIDCHAGEYSDVEGATSCKACPVGKYSIKTESNSCMGCPAGQYTDTVGSTRCKSCPAGKYSNGVESTMCMTCPAGKYSDKLESTSCMGCPAGQYSETTGSTSCEACPPGKYSNNVASTSCKTCPAGQYNNRAGARSCRVCRAGTYSSAGSTGCRTCPRGMNSRQGSSRCTCPSGYTMSRGSCFKVYGNAKNYDGARRACISDSGRLAMPKSSAVNTFIQGLARRDKRNGDYFIGLSDERVEGHWRFADNSPLGSYKNWNPREPNNYRGGEDCVVMRYNGRWNDQNCRRAFPYICQIN
ncbi:PREDICTED: uncharacterized protein LOC109474722 [Branchiostoma belcheri]|uniref:Uncharacterized protein LOC109474722 n=1 Tax=Branchiostoma belcheri TaxID=7741 RepID=A0A6P4Z9N0_BRABE|nr:PREDICTED: uncharacterized protein LOC109474722 [Branchiostoma belcheri]